MVEKIKIVNDPVHGFIRMPTGVGFNIVNHRWFQRLRNIKQLGLAHLVYPGATHTRFQHSLGAYHLMQQAIETLRSKGFEITDKEAHGVLLGILLHDIGHAPYSHTLENIILPNINHEEVTSALIIRLNKEFDYALDTTIDIMKNRYVKKFLHQLISSQLDMDRLDYLKRDSFYTGVSEGVIGTERIIKMLTISNDALAVEEKGIYSIEKFLIARRLMYWQVYLHKTVLAAELMMHAIFKRVYFLFQNGKIELPFPLSVFWTMNIKPENLTSNTEIIDAFAQIDDNDVWIWVKQWSNHEDFVLSMLAKRFIERKLFKVEMSKSLPGEDKIKMYRKKLKSYYNLSDEEVEYFVFSDYAENSAYSSTDNKINILFKNGKTVDIAEASDILNIDVLSKNVIKYYLCFLPECLE